MERIVLFTGAGTSAEAGIPTFRVDAAGKTALWNNVDPKTVCNILTYMENIELCCTFYNEIRTLISKISPTSFHEKVKIWQDDLEKEKIELIVMTQNVDDLFERAGVKNVKHIHGDIRYMQCLQGGHRWFIGYEEQKPFITCPLCHSFSPCKPGIVFFNENAPAYEDTIRLLESLDINDALIVMGTSCSVFPIHYFLEKKRVYKIYSALELPGKIPQSDLDEIVLEKCTTAIDKIIQFVDKRKNKTT